MFSAQFGKVELTSPSFRVASLLLVAQVEEGLPLPIMSQAPSDDQQSFFGFLFHQQLKSVLPKKKQKN